MLPPDFLKQAEKQIVDVYSKLELQIIEEIAVRIANFGYANTVAINDVKIAQEMGVLYQDVVQMVASYNNQSYEEIQNIFENAGIETLKYDDKIYKKAGLKPIPIKQNKAMLQLLLATAKKTNNNLQNLCMTTANTSQTQFYNAINKAYMQVSTGVKSYSSAIVDTIQEISNQGTYIEYPSGQHRSLESAIRTNIVTSVNQTCGKLQEMRADELGWDLMELTAHGGARPDHAVWQGQIVSRSGQKGYLSLDDIGYGEATGFKGVNCRHDWRPYYRGSSRTYNDKELEKMKNETVVYQGKEISRYDASQIQRRMERQIRQDKKDVAGMQAVALNGKDEKVINQAKEKLQELKIKQSKHNNELNNFLDETGFRKDYSRLSVGKMTNTNKSGIIKEHLATNNILEKLKIDLNDYKPFGKVNPFENNIQEKTAELLNLDKLPQIVNKEQYMKAQGQEILRVLHASKGKTAQEAFENTLYGKIQYSSFERSEYGRGIYFGGSSIGEHLKNFYGQKDNKLIVAKLSEKAKIKEFDNRFDYFKDVAKRLEKIPKEQVKFFENERSLLYMLDGYDGIKIKDSNYFCIYNRKVLLINV